MKNNYIISKMDKSNIAEVKDLENELNIDILSEKSISSDLENNNYTYFVLKDIQKQNKIVGYIAVSHIIDTMDIISIVIKKDYHRKGLASYLLNYVIDFARQIKITNILLEVRTSNIPAQKLYEKYKFKLISKRKNYYNNPVEDALIYKLELK